MKRLLIHQSKTTRFLISLLLIISCWFVLAPAILFASQVMVTSHLYSVFLLLALFFVLFPVGAVIYIWTRPRITCSKEESFSSAEQLKKYAGLKDKGIITEEEFQAKKKQILGL
tara:strand:+ start:190 stop:531 length:342 start_codon:yes stop_codon:yes gene_type:complete